MKHVKLDFNGYKTMPATQCQDFLPISHMGLRLSTDLKHLYFKLLSSQQHSAFIVNEVYMGWWKGNCSFVKEKASISENFLCAEKIKANRGALFDDITHLWVITFFLYHYIIIHAQYIIPWWWLYRDGYCHVSVKLLYDWEGQVWVPWMETVMANLQQLLK